MWPTAWAVYCLPVTRISYLTLWIRIEFMTYWNCENGFIVTSYNSVLPHAHAVLIYCQIAKCIDRLKGKNDVKWVTSWELRRPYRTGFVYTLTVLLWRHYLVIIGTNWNKEICLLPKEEDEVTWWLSPAPEYIFVLVFPLLTETKIRVCISKYIQISMWEVFYSWGCLQGWL